MDYDKAVSQEKLNFIFEGGYEVDALTVSKTIESLVNIMSITAKTEYPDTELRLSISAVKPGSLEVYFHAIAEYAKNLLSGDNIRYATGIATLLSYFFKIKNHLKNKKPKAITQDDNNIKIENINGNVLIAPKGANIYFNNVNIDVSISNIFSALKSSSDVMGVSLSVGDEDPVSISQDSFEELSTPIENLIEPANQISYSRTEILFIKKPDLLGDSMWVFQSDKQLIAEIDDKDFMQRVHSGEIKVCAGMSITAEIKVQYDIGENSLPIEKTSRYSVSKVLDINIPGEGQMTL